MIDSILDLEKFYEKIQSYKEPEDLFGTFESDIDIYEEIKKQHKILLKKYHPDLFANESSYVINIVNEISKHLNVLYTAATKKTKENTYGKSDNSFKSFVMNIGKNSIKVNEYIKSGDFADVYGGIFFVNKKEKPVVIKVVRNCNDNDLLENEQQILKTLNHKSIPKFYISAKMKDGRRFNVIERIFGIDINTLITIKYTNGVHVEDFAWIFLRLLSVVGHLHFNDIKNGKIGILHGNIEPSNILIRGYDHNVFICDYVTSIINNGKSMKFKAYNDIYSAPEVKDKEQPIPHSDMFSLGKSMIFLLGGDPKKNQIPIYVPEPIKYILLSLVEEEPIKRVKDAWELWNLFTTLRLELFGKKLFKPFITN